MQFDFLERFVAKKRNVIVYAFIKVSIAIFLFIMVAREQQMALKIVFLAGGFIVLMSMVPVLTIYYVERKKEKNKINE